MICVTSSLLDAIQGQYIFNLFQVYLHIFIFEGFYNFE